MNKWKKPEEEKPPQGTKVLCMHKGDLYVAQRYKDYWFSIPFYDSKFSRYLPPEYWQEIDFPIDLMGKVRSKINDVFYDMDELEKHHPNTFNELVEAQLKMFKRGKKDE